MKKSLIIMVVILFSVFLSTSASARVGLSVISYINLLDGPYQQKSDDPYAFLSVSSVSNGTSKATACIKELYTEVESFSTGLSHPAAACSFVSITFSVEGNTNEVEIPITIVAKLKGRFFASSLAGDKGSIAYGRVSWCTYEPGGGDWGIIMVQGGIPVIQKSIDTSDIWATIVPRIVISVGAGAPITITLTPEDLIELGFDPEIFEFSSTDKWSYYAALICNAVTTFGLNKYNILPGADAALVMDVTFRFNANAEIKKTIVNSGVFILNVHSMSACTTDIYSHGYAKFVAGIKGADEVLEEAPILISASVPYDYEHDVEGMSLVLADGMEIPIIREPAPFVEIEVILEPEVINPRSQENSITVYAELPEELSVYDVETLTISIKDTQILGTDYEVYVEDGVDKIKAKFDKQALISALEEGIGTVTIEGYLSDGTLLKGYADIRII